MHMTIDWRRGIPTEPGLYWVAICPTDEHPRICRVVQSDPEKMIYEWAFDQKKNGVRVNEALWAKMAVPEVIG